MKTCKTYFLCALFNLLAISPASAQSIVGAWTSNDSTAEGASVVVFFANGWFIQIQNARASEAPHGFDGFERGTYTWNPATGAFAVTVVQDLNGDTGLSNLSGLSGITVSISGDTLTANIPGSGSTSANRVTGSSPIVGAWGGAFAAADSSAALVFLSNGVYFMAEDGDSTQATGDPSGHDGIEHGTYSWNQTTGVLTSSRTPAPFVDTNGEWGLSHPRNTLTFSVSTDGLTLTGTDGQDSFSLPRAGVPGSSPAPANYQGLWWKSDEPYWGVNLAHQGDQVFATWYTYDTSGNAYWLSMLAGRTTPTGNAYKGDVYVDVGPPFNNFLGSGTPTKVGDGTVTFSDADNGTFAYQVTAGGATNVQQTKPITRFTLGGAQPVCTYAGAPNLAAATNYQDLWWVPTESGWGVNFAHQGNLMFATWYTYGTNTAPLWLSALMTRQGTSNVYTGSLTRTSGPRFDNYKASDVAQPIPTLGTATATFTDGNHATFAYSTNGTAGLPAVPNQSKSITRFLFAAPAGTVCQ